VFTFRALAPVTRVPASLGPRTSVGIGAAVEVISRAVSAAVEPSVGVAVFVSRRLVGA
jgi:hypothetical protein